MLILLLSILYGAHPSLPATYAIEYSIHDIEHNMHSTQYIVVQDNSVYVLYIDNTADDYVIADKFSNLDSTYTFIAITHSQNLVVCHEVSYDEYNSNAEEIYRVEFTSSDSMSVVLMDKNENIKRTVYLSKEFPNVHPATIMYKEVKYLPKKIVYDNKKVVEFVRMIEDEEMIEILFETMDYTGYTKLDLGDIKTAILELTGMTYDQVEEFLKDNSK